MSNFAGFNSVQLTKPQRSQFDLSHFKRTSTRMGRLTPVFISECVPSDTFHGSSEILLRLAPLLSPIYDNIQLYVHFYFIPNRLLWEEWETFITGGRLGVGVDPLVEPIPPFVNLGPILENDPEYFQKSSLADYLGVPVFEDLPGFVAADYTAEGVTLQMLPFLAYQRCWYDYYRDRNFVADEIMEFPVPSGVMADYDEFLSVRTRCYEHDYFTSALPFTQRGVEVLMPLAGTATPNYFEISKMVEFDSGDPSATGSGVNFSGVSTIDPPWAGTGMRDPANIPVRIENIEDVTIDGSNVSINDFRSAYALQVWFERNAVAGSRYTESTQAHFGVRPQDSRLQRAEYIGGGRIAVKISEIVSTAYSDDGTGTVPLANLAGHGITYGNTNQFNYFCAEHGFIIGIASIMNPPSYHQGLPRMFKRTSFLDYPWPTFAKLGEQEVKTYELYASAANLSQNYDDGEYPTFGYQSRYADWKFLPNTNHGEFHDTLLFWTLTRQFADSPVLGYDFTQFNGDDQSRIFAVNGSGDNFWMYVHNNVRVRRPLPYFGQPNTLGFA